MNNKKARGLNGVVFLVFVVFLFAALWFTNQFDQREKEISWKKFQQLVQNDKIESVEVNQNKSVPTGRVEITLKGDDSSTDDCSEDQAGPDAAGHLGAFCGPPFPAAPAHPAQAPVGICDNLRSRACGTAG